MNFDLIQTELLSIGITKHLQIKILKSVIALFILYFVRGVITRIISHKAEQNEILYKWEKIVTYTFYICTILVIGNIWFKGVQSLATFFGLLTAGLAVAFKDFLSNIAGWLYIIWMEPFKNGHRVHISDIVGDVIDIGPVHISLLEIGNFSNSEQPTGKIIFLPNSKVFTSSIANYDISFPYIWHEINVIVTFESNWRKAKDIVTNTLKNNSLVYDEAALKKFKTQSRKFLIPKVSLDPEIFTSTADHGVVLSARFICEPRNRRSIEKKVWESILDSFESNDDIDFAYPTQRFFNNPLEGKSKTGGPS